MAIDIRNPSADLLAFLQEYGFSTLTTVRSNGGLHSVVVRATYDTQTREVRIITRKGSQKVVNITSSLEPARVTVCQTVGPKWVSFEGTAEVVTDGEAVDDAVARYGARFGRTPAPDPERVLIKVAVDRAIGLLALPQ
ncbi:pyridoxamine 5'-phosphate oxidase family protein [Streptomyces olivoreticuli]